MFSQIWGKQSVFNCQRIVTGRLKSFELPKIDLLLKDFKKSLIKENDVSSRIARKNSILQFGVLKQISLLMNNHFKLSFTTILFLNNIRNTIDTSRSFSVSFQKLSYYQRLGITEKATAEEIKKAYHKVT